MSNLTERAHGTAVERRPEGGTLRDQIMQMESQFALAMPKGMEAAQLVRDALTALKQTPKLAEATPQSVLGALMTCAQLGLRPGVLGHAWVLPYWDSKSRSFVAQLIVGYKGYVELAYRSGHIASIIGRTVYEGDTFDVEYGLDDKLVHKPAMKGERTTPIAHYAMVKLANGGRSFWVMTEDEMQAWKKRYAPTNKSGNIVGPWVSDYEAMARKTCLLRLAAWLPKSTEMAYAIEVDNGVRTNVDPSASLTEVTHRYEQVTDPDEAGAGGTVPGEVVDRSLCPECTQGKHPNCSGQAWDSEADAPGPCTCTDESHGAKA
jgi:recombination protein RecT